MTPLWTSEAIAEATGGTANSSFDVTGVAFDSREVAPGDLFVALRGEHADGHDFIPMALAAGAGGLLVEREVNGPFVKVADAARGLEDLGRASRRRTGARIIGVTGSAGKTGTKEALYRAFDRMSFGGAHRSLKSYNNHVGVPLSLARMPAMTRYGIFEMGMNHEGELRALSRMVRPHVAIVTTIAPAHIEYFGSEEKIADAKAEIFEGLTSDGTAIIPADSPHASRLYNVAARHAARIVTFGLRAGADVRVVEEAPSARGGTLVTAQLRTARLSFTVAMPGRHWVSNALAVLAAVEAVGGDLAQAGLALAEMNGLPGRGARRTLRTADGGEALLIDESYNANPASMAATLAQLGEERGERRIAVLGAMKELGALSESLHRGLADAVRAAGVSLAVLVGDEMAPLADALAGDVPVERAKDVTDVLDLLPGRLRGGDVILVKGSNSIGLSRLVDRLAAEEVAA
ncbi:UDP-N-acetylmuramoyl-tripeptide--D-alanyl-D-alanine ligase [Sphingobium lignivorans]|uniref:UDP-N-acetylmuramoyl-tripeptide--D-alanyl-D-alanine ligase n=1 Tax=Sphingobium lignivorans TaxID=2735886 RepID=A0ABR6NBC3_9SPHN|nr:UDP-N-acetylmuramoyl-tripeptide--D-alanyl-D-alanine ligase [Sphingobium lignivorans]MBB5984586.1 UDP-N-acetylmuramoyl-tripeptide--D-alanyl-D-alanine ligase [Sphingobium lignivorans]